MVGKVIVSFIFLGRILWSLFKRKKKKQEKKTNQTKTKKHKHTTTNEKKKQKTKNYKTPPTRNRKNKSALGWIPWHYSTHPPVPVTFKIIHDAKKLWPEHAFHTKNIICMTYLQCSWTMQHIQWVNLYHKYSIYKLPSTSIQFFSAPDFPLQSTEDHWCQGYSFSHEHKIISEHFTDFFLLWRFFNV